MVGKYPVWIYAVNCFIFSFIHGQNYVLKFSFHSYEQIALDEQKNIYLVSPSKATLTKFFQHQNYDSSIVVGGKNLSLKESFVKPEEILIPDSKTIFLLDPLSNDIKLLNTNLKIQRVWNFNQVQGDLQPFQLHSAAIAPSGEMFIQNKLNSLIYRINTFGEIDRTIGGNNYAEASITDAAKLACTKEHLYVWVQSEKKIYQFDHNGNFIKTYEFSINIEKIVSDIQNLIGYGKSQVYLFTKNGVFINILEHNLPIIDLYFIDNQIYILDELGVSLYVLKKSKSMDR
jgi:hypothetical protein